MSIDTRGVEHGAMRVTLRDDQPGGISIDGVDYAPGDTFDAPHGIAMMLVSTDRARRAEAEASADAGIKTRDPVLQAQAVTGKKRR